MGCLGRLASEAVLPTHGPTVADGLWLGLELLLLVPLKSAAVVFAPYQKQTD